MISRRQFLQVLAIAAASPRLEAGAPTPGRFGKLRADPNRILDLPAGFEYRVISEHGDVMDDGLFVPPRADGMAAFDTGNGLVTLVCNHENHPATPGAFGKKNARLRLVDRERVYDNGRGKTPGTGGTTTIHYDPAAGRVRRRFLSLAGTEINCAGGPTPWGSWLSCEECFENPGESGSSRRPIYRERRHGYVFEVPADAEGLVEPVPLKAMGRFEHEAAAVDPASNVIYLSEDRHRSLLYRFLPNEPGRLIEGGRLQALAIKRQPSFDTRNWDSDSIMPVREWFETQWVDIDDPDPDEDVVRLDGYEKGAARFARGEGLVFAEGSLFMTATIGGAERLGQVFEYRPSPDEGTTAESRSPGRIRLFAECSPETLLHNADNLTMSPWGDLVICEDTLSSCGLVGMTPDGEQYAIADNAYSRSELAGICFSPDGATMFVNVQHRGLTLAITGPWETSAS